MCGSREIDFEIFLYLAPPMAPQGLLSDDYPNLDFTYHKDDPHQKM